MTYLKNYLLLFIIKFSNRFGRAHGFKMKIFSSQRILEINFPKNKSFNFIQVGANDGISFDFLFDFVIQRDSSGIVIEPVKEYFDELKLNYKDFPKIIKINKAVHPCNKEVAINKIAPNAIDKYPDWVKGIASLDSEHHKKTGIDSNDIIKERVKADTLMNIIKTNFKNIQLDYFQVDTEGFDYEVIKMIDFSVVMPYIIKYESVNLNNEDQTDLMLLLNEQGYFLFKEFGDTIGVNLKKVKIY
ncbi:FkbM family methyltransferase [Flavobacterium sp. LB1P71]|uniref:FkbM family methyltransferase n=1 Tax=unclassified Flavobacterium TaxID=196869 RepID=UPI003AB0B3D5